MKHIYIVLRWIIISFFIFATASVYAQSGTIQFVFPADQTFYYTNSSRNTTVKVIFYYDDNNDCVCNIFRNGSILEWYCLNNNRGDFYGFKYTPEYKLQQSLYGGMPMMQLTGKIIKSKTNNTLSVVSDLHSITINGVKYDVTLSKAEYSKLWETLYGKGGGGTNIIYNNNSSNNNSSADYNSGSASIHGESVCSVCGGTGRCSSCNGRGHKASIYNAEEQECPSCRGNGRCYNCYGTGKIR